MRKNRNPVYRLGDFLARFSKSVVSGIPREKALAKPRSGKYLHLKKESLPHDSEKHYKPRIHRKTMDHFKLIKEKGRVRAEE